MTADEGVESREKWSNKAEFILSCLGYAVGLGNVWRFPYMCGQYGGAAFMIPYFIMMVFAGFPTFYMELAIGQYASLTPHLLYRRMCPIFTGIGQAMVCISAFTAIYYNMIMAWAFYYFGVSFTSRLPWSDCTQEWNNYKCRDTHCYNSSHISILNSKCFERTILNTTDGSKFASDPVITKMLQDRPLNTSVGQTVLSKIIQLNGDGESPAHQYYNIHVLAKNDGLENGLGGLKWDLVLCLFVAWVTVFFCLIKGIKSSGKVVYFTATFPYVILVILLIRGCTLEGAIYGINFYVNPNVTYLADAEVWGAAAGQIFFSLSLGGGGLTTLASYNEFHNNLFRDTLIVVLGNCATSVFAGFVIFPIIGFIAGQTGQSVADISAGGSGLDFAAFIVYADAVTRLPVAPFWAILFFFMLIILAIDTMIVIVEVVTTAIIDQYPTLRAWKKKMLVVGGVCTLFFLCGLILCTPGGSYVLTIMDKYAGGWTLIVACFFEIVMVSWVYGVRKFIGDIRCMLGVAPNKFYRILGYPVNWFWIVTWAAITPIMLGVILIVNVIDMGRTTEGTCPGKDCYTYPIAADIIGWMLTLCCILWIPIMAIYELIMAKKNGKGFRYLITPTDEWGPSDFKERQKIEGIHPMTPPANISVISPTAPPSYPSVAYAKNGYSNDGYTGSTVTVNN